MCIVCVMALCTSTSILGVQPFCGKEPHASVWTGWQAAHGKRKSGIHNHLNCCVVFTVTTPIYICGCGLKTHDLDVSQLIYWNPTKYIGYFCM